MAEDMFGDSSLFDEFEKDRESKGTFILYKLTEEGEEDKSQIHFRVDDSEGGESSSDSDSGESENENKDDEHDENHLGSHFDHTPIDVVNGTELKVEKSTEFKLTHERNKFARYSRIIDSTRFVPDRTSPACQVIYQNNNFSRKYRTLIEQYISHLIARDEESDRRKERLPELQLKSSNLTCVDLNNKLSADQRNMKMWSSHAILGSSQFHKEFMIDPLGWPLVANNPSLTDSWEAPKYEQIYTDPLPLEEEEEEADPGPSKPPRKKQTCFNCGGEHMIAECPDPKDFTRIRQNRDKFRQESGQQKKGPGRYHKDTTAQMTEDNNFAPGVLSDELMDALGISSQYLPSYIYKMRVLGYPPGWLEEAKVQTSGLILFDREGNEVDLTGESLEDGEVDGAVPNKGQIDPQKIIEYPGFTVAIPPDTIDEYEELGAPPLQEHQLKRTLTAQISSLKRKNEEVEEEARQKRMKLDIKNVQEMDLSGDEDNNPNKSVDSDGFVPPLPMDTPPSKPAPPNTTPPVTPDALRPKRLPVSGEPPLPFNSPPGKPPIPDGTPPATPDGAATPKHKQVTSLSNSGTRQRSPSLEDLEEQYQQLQKKLIESDGDGESQLHVMDSCEGDEAPDAAKGQLSKVSSMASDSSSSSAVDIPQREMSRINSAASITSFGELGRGSPTSSLPGTPVVGPSSDLTELNFAFKSTTGSISRDYGTPIQSRQGVADSLPDSLNFGQGIEDHIPYENLPAATGTFEKMRGLIDRIRQKVTIRKKIKKS